MTRPHSCTLRRLAVIAFACVVSAANAALAAETPAEPTFAAEELEQIVAPIALYPIRCSRRSSWRPPTPRGGRGARFAEENPELKDTALDDALKDKTWDPSVKSLVSFPQVLTMMNEKLDWTQKLGDAFLAQQKDVMNAVQRSARSAPKRGISRARRSRR
jgi:hypothetical protein